MKIEIGKERIVGFKFEHLTEGIAWRESMNYYVNQKGKIVSIHHDGFMSVGVKFRDGQVWYYPFEMAKNYLIKDEEIIPTFLIDGYETKQQQIIIKLSEGINEILTKIQNRNNMKNLKITTPEGYEIDKENSTFENIVFKPIEKELPKSLIELGEIIGYYTNGFGRTTKTTYSRIEQHNLSTQLFATKEQAEASLALAQLSQLREVYRDGWKPDWMNITQNKYCLYFYNGKIYEATFNRIQVFLSFQSAEVRDLFLENFRDLIEQAKPLMS